MSKTPRSSAAFLNLSAQRKSLAHEGYQGHQVFYFVIFVSFVDKFLKSNHPSMRKKYNMKREP